MTPGVALFDSSGVAKLRTQFGTPGDRVVTVIANGDRVSSGGAQP